MIHYNISFTKKKEKKKNATLIKNDMSGIMRMFGLSLREEKGPEVKRLYFYTQRIELRRVKCYLHKK